MSQTSPTIEYVGVEPTRGLARVAGQTLSLFADAYRQINASALFWIAVILSALVAGIIGVPSIGPEGVSVFGYVLIPGLTDDDLEPATMYKLLFTAIGLTAPLIAWLTIWSNLLAIITTAGIFPDLVNGQGTDLYLSKPIGRVRLFFTKYLAGLLFVAVQVSVFCVIGFLVIGIRGGAWEPAVLLGVPLMLLLFSYLWAISTLIGVWTRSMLLAVLLTVVAWMLLWGLQTAESTLLAFRTAAEVRVERAATAVENAQANLARVADASERRRETWQLQLDAAEDVQAQAADNLDDIRVWHNVMFGVYTALPKTQATAGLVERWLIDAADLPQGDDDGDAPEPVAADQGLMETLGDDPEVPRRMQEAIEGRSVAYILGTSLAAEAVLLGLACWIFVRRDY